MKIGDIVRSKNPNGIIKSPGKIVSMIDADYYIKYTLPKNGVTLESIDVIWQTTSPNWKNEPICVLLFDKPHRTASLEEWVKSGKTKGLEEDELIKEYEERCPTVEVVIFPIGDLELVKES